MLHARRDLVIPTRRIGVTPNDGVRGDDSARKHLFDDENARRMQRRTVLGALWVALGGWMSGCTIQTPSSTPLSDDTDVSQTPDPTPPETSDQPSTPARNEFEQCEKLIIRIENLPLLSRSEVIKPRRD